jgi:hypothetical protein
MVIVQVGGRENLVLYINIYVNISTARRRLREVQNENA